jgi:hypothetical protein
LNREELDAEQHQEIDRAPATLPATHGNTS